MHLSFLPTMLTQAVTDLRPEFLEGQNIRLLMLDFDNTIIPYTTNEPTEQMARWLQTMQVSPIRLCVVSNSRKGRVKEFCLRWGIDCITDSKKPGNRGIRKCLARYGIDPSQAAMVGDQIFTDTLGANLAGCRSILVKPIHNHNFWLKLRHLVEKPIIFMSRKRRISL